MPHKLPAQHVPEAQKPRWPGQVPTDDVSEQRQRAEAEEVAGRHKYDGQKDHKGAR